MKLFDVMDQRTNQKRYFHFSILFHSTSDWGAIFEVLLILFCEFAVMLCPYGDGFIPRLPSERERASSNVLCWNGLILVKSIWYFFTKWAIPGLFFFIFCHFRKQLTAYKCSIKVANDWIRTRVLWFRKRPLCQLRHSQCPFWIVSATNIFWPLQCLFSIVVLLFFFLFNPWLTFLYRELLWIGLKIDAQYLPR